MRKHKIQQSYDDKLIEHDRYELRAKNLLRKRDFNLKNIGSKSVKQYLRSPYIKYEEIIKNLNLDSSHKVLELASGMGEFSNLLVDSSCQLICSDISATSLKNLQAIYKPIKKVKCDVVDIENLQYANYAFDFVFMAGGLSYGNNHKVLEEIHRILKNGGKFIVVDSLNSNPVYRFNRWINYLRGKRSINTLKRMPNLLLIQKYIDLFGEGKAYYFGGFSWFFNIFSIFFNFVKVNSFSNWLDNLFCIKNSAFKFILIVKKNK